MIRLVLCLFMFFLSLTSQSFAQNEVVGKGLICKGTDTDDYFARFFNEASRSEYYETKESFLHPGDSNSFPLVDIYIPFFLKKILNLKLMAIHGGIS